MSPMHRRPVAAGKRDATSSNQSKPPPPPMAEIPAQPPARRRRSHDGYTLVPLRRRPLLLRHDVLPFALLYALLVVLDQTSSPTVTVAFPIVLLMHVALFLAQQWKVGMRRLVGYHLEKQFCKWTHCHVMSVGGGSHDAGEIVAVQFSDKVATVTFRNVVFRACKHHHEDDDDDMDGLWTAKPMQASSKDAAAREPSDRPPSFHRLHYPEDLPLDFYQQWKGHISLNSLRRTETIYGDNSTHIDLPPFLSLLADQLLAPFFLFQLLCVMLWSLDEYWMYAIFTLFALVLFECTVAYNRLKSLERLRETLRHPVPIYAYRHQVWSVLKTNEVVPGDVVSLVSGTNIPADLLLLQGRAVVDEALLTGESVPQLKHSLEDCEQQGVSKLDTQEEHKRSVLFGGTVLVNHNNNTDGGTGGSSIPPPPNGGVVCFTLKTGFETLQGSLLRTMAHTSSKADGVNTRDTFLFVSLLLLCAVASAGLVLREGWYDETRNQFKLVLHVIIIITSVVPPELPMELSLAVTNSVADLMKRCHVYCTEPYRIPWAGKVDVCCFDKTGTLTSDEMRLRGIRLPGQQQDLVHAQHDDVPWNVLRVMVACHSLALCQGKKPSSDQVMGDPLERAVLRDTSYRLRRDDTVVPSDASSGGPVVSIRHRFAFSSKLKRMTVLATEGNSDETIWALTKGAPETMKGLFKAVPENYTEAYMHHMGLGQRVLAMGYRHFTSAKSVDSLKKEGRDAVERDLTFAGLLVLDCPLKSDSRIVIKELQSSGHKVVMITGDAVLTAAEVARQVSIVKGKTPMTYELKEMSNPNDKFGVGDEPSRFIFVPIHASELSKSATSSEECIAFVPSNMNILRDMSRSEASFCVSGDVLTKVAAAAVIQSLQEKHARGGIDPSMMDEKNILLHPAAQSVLTKLVPIISVFARHAPRQKEAVVSALNAGGHYTLMCGDGTNDVGALKRAHVGISIISAPELEAKQRAATETLAKVKAEQKSERKARRKMKNGADGAQKLKKKSRSSILEESLRQLAEAEEELDYVALGDASVASPFTSRAVSIRCCKDVLQQGRCTLVTMLQIYKILGVNCLVNALVLTKLHMHGVKQGDRQLTALGIAVAGLFFFVTRGRPLATLSRHRPPSTVLCGQVLLSIASQFAIHFCAIMIATHMSLSYVDPYDPSIIPDGPFNPNVLNTCTFLLTVLATINTFVVNYRGRPYMENLKDNAMLVRSLKLCYGVLFLCALEVFPPLNQLLQLAPLPDSEAIALFSELNAPPNDAHSWLSNMVSVVGFNVALCLLMVVDSLLSYVTEKAIVRHLEGC